MSESPVQVYVVLAGAARLPANSEFTRLASVELGLALRQDTGALLPDIRSVHRPVRRSGRPRMWPISWAAMRVRS